MKNQQIDSKNKMQNGTRFRKYSEFKWMKIHTLRCFFFSSDDKRDATLDILTKLS